MMHSDFFQEQELQSLIEDTFNDCTSNLEEIYWIISLLRGFMNIPNKRSEDCLANIKLNQFQYDLHPIIEKFKKKWHHSNY